MLLSELKENIFSFLSSILFSSRLVFRRSFITELVGVWEARRSNFFTSFWRLCSLSFFFCKNCMILFYLSWRPLLFPMLLFQKCYWFQWRMPILVWNSPEIPCLWVMSWSAVCGGGWGWCSAKKVILMGAWSEMIMLWMVGSFILYVIELLTIK